MKLPPLTHLQFAVLNEIGEATMSGRELRAQLKKQGIKKSGPAFYQLMARLEELKYVEGWYTQQIIDSQIIRQRHYRITTGGKNAYDKGRDFYWTGV